MTVQYAYGLWAESPAQLRVSKTILPLVLPSERQLHKIKSQNKCQDGADIKAVQLLASSKNWEEVRHAIFYCDEMKVKNGVMWNSQTGKATGHTKDMLDLSSILKRLLSEEGDEVKPAEYVNCWKCIVFGKKVRGLDRRLLLQ